MPVEGDDIGLEACAYASCIRTAAECHFFFAPGKLLGGCSATNATMFVPLDPKVYITRRSPPSLFVTELGSSEEHLQTSMNGREKPTAWTVLKSGRSQTLKSMWPYAPNAFPPLNFSQISVEI